MACPNRSPTRSSHHWPAAAVVLVAAWILMGWLGDLRAHPVEMLCAYLLASLAWGIACRAVLNGGQGPSTRWIVVVAMACRLAALPGEPTDDMARYRWEGLVQLAGHDPYREAPNAPALAPLAAQFSDHQAINHPDWPAIYPPGMELWQRGVAALSPTALAFKLSFLGAEALLFAALLAWLKGRGLPANRLVLFAWCPLSVYATAFEGHHDVIAATALVLGIVALEARRPSAAAMALCAAVLTKGFAVAALPAFALARRPSPSASPSAQSAVISPRSWLAGLALAAVITLPFLGQGGPLPSVLRFGSELHYNDSGHALLASLFGDGVSRPLAAAAWILGAFWVLRDSPADTARRVALLLGGLLLVLPTMHPWYLMTLLPLLTVFPWWGWLALTASVSLTWLPHLEIANTGQWVEWHGLKLPEYAPLFAWLAWVSWGSFLRTQRPPPSEDTAFRP
ncbi:MAG: hypothetical protein ACI9EF_002582 [Pseudohongiellaceae bacterium]|jgi:hypothetical protein